MSSFSGIQVEDFRQMLANILGESIYHINWIGYDKMNKELFFQIRSHIDIRTFHEGRVKKFLHEKCISEVELMEQTRRTTRQSEDRAASGGEYLSSAYNFSVKKLQFCNTYSVIKGGCLRNYLTNIVALA